MGLYQERFEFRTCEISVNVLNEGKTMKWQLMFKTKSDNIIYLNDRTPFIIIDGVVHVPNIISVPLTVEEESSLNTVHSLKQKIDETNRLKRAIQRAKFRSRLATLFKWGAGIAVLTSSLVMLNGIAITAATLYSSAKTDTLQPHKKEFTQEAIDPDSDFKVQVSSGLTAGEKRDDVSIKFGPENSQNVLYVYSDPLCPHCKEVDNSLKELSEQGVKVVIFPVSVIGGDTSKQAAANIMCLPTNDEKQKAWQKLLSGTVDADDTDVSIHTCSKGIESINTNNLFFKKAGFLGTPTILNKHGEQPNADVPATIQGIKDWAKQ